jgi:hypothetical protein
MRLVAGGEPEAVTGAVGSPTGRGIAASNPPTVKARSTVGRVFWFGRRENVTRIYKPGEICRQSGQYAIVDAEGKIAGPERTVVRESKFPPPPESGQGYLLVDPTRLGTPDEARHSRQVCVIVAYYLIVLLFSFWLLFDTWSSNFVLMRLIGVGEEALKEPLLRTIGFTIVGGLLGSVLYHIRALFHFYAWAKTYDPRWLGKYITSPWEGAGMAIVVLSLIRGGVAVFGGSMGTDVTGASNFAALGTGALVGFGMRDVVGWLGTLIHTMFSIPKPKDEDSPAKEDEPYAHTKP